MRVIAGKYRSRLLQPLRDVDLRPTSDRLRETLFNILTAGNPSALEGTVWLDLYAGTGAVGIEALSRGAGMVYFVESAASAADLVQKNLRTLEVATGSVVIKQDVGRALETLAAKEVAPDFIFLDPPYALDKEYAKTLGALGASALVSPKTMVIVEHQKRFDPGEEFGALRRYRKLVQSDAALSFYKTA